MGLGTYTAYAQGYGGDAQHYVWAAYYRKGHANAGFVTDSLQFAYDDAWDNQP